MLFTEIASPVRVNTQDNPLSILQFAVREAQAHGAALATLVEVRGGGARSLGSHIAIAADGRFCGYVSGGCVEAAVASEALKAMNDGRDRLVRYGEGSPFFDITLPCGGGITVAIHVIRQTDAIETVIQRIESRQIAGLIYDIHNENLTLSDRPAFRSHYQDGAVHTVYRPATRIIVSGQTGEAEVVRLVAQAAGFEVQTLAQSTDAARDLADNMDAFSAVVLLHHDLDAEQEVLRSALCSNAFYIGALGSTRTHRKRLDRLKDAGIPSEAFDRIRAPIGLFGPTRDASSLALSVLADVAAARLEAFPG